MVPGGKSTFLAFRTLVANLPVLSACPSHCAPARPIHVYPKQVRLLSSHVGYPSGKAALFFLWPVLWSLIHLVRALFYGFLPHRPLHSLFL